jgi:flagellin-like protein
MKGVSPLIAAVMLIVITVAASILISGWLSTTTTAEAEKIRNQTNVQLQCQYADIYIKNATYDCDLNCTEGTQHSLTVTVVNSGKKTVTFDTAYVRNTTGVVTALVFNETKTLNVADALTVSNSTRATCSGINNTIESITINSITCPSTAYASIQSSDITYTNC